MNRKLLLLWIIGAVMTTSSQAQVTGGRFSFPFLNLSNSPHVTAMGGVVPASYDDDISLMMQNPALLNKTMHNQLALGYNFYFSDIGIMNLSYGFHSKKHQTTYGFGVVAVNYGNFSNTDIYGNYLGDVKASDMVVNFSAARIYGEKWHYGAHLKLANSNLGGRTAFAVLADVGIAYRDTANRFSLGIVAKNMGVTVKKYNPNNSAEPLPFDLQLGVMKGFKNIPLRIFASIHHMYEWDIRYNDPANLTTDLFNNPTEDIDAPHFVDKLFRHVNVGAELTLGKMITATVGYSHIRRQELGYKLARGMAGFSMGAQIDLKRIEVQYGLSNFGNGAAYHEFGFIFPLNKIIKAKGGFAKTGWNDVY